MRSIKSIHGCFYRCRLCQRFDIIQKLLWIAVNHLSRDRIEVPIGLIAQLSYYQEGEWVHFRQSLSNRVECSF